MRGTYGLLALLAFSMLGSCTAEPEKKEVVEEAKPPVAATTPEPQAKAQRITLAASPLNGTKWRVEITPKGAEIPWYVDQVRFEDGNFTSAIFARKGFSTSPYTLTEKGGGPLIWEATQTSETEGTLSWRGELEGDSMKGTVIGEQPDGKVVNHTFTGRKVTEPPAPKP